MRNLHTVFQNRRALRIVLLIAVAFVAVNSGFSHVGAALHISNRSGESDTYIQHLSIPGDQCDGNIACDRKGPYAMAAPLLDTGTIKTQMRD